jgi:hypothetical protein
LFFDRFLFFHLEFNQNLIFDLRINQAVPNSMKKFTAALIFLLPIVTFGQLFPKIPDFKGNIKQVTEKRYGKEFDLSGLLKKTHYPSLYSGWKYTYQFNNQSRLIKQTNTFHGKIEVEYLYQYDTIENRRIEREITSDKSKNNQGDYTEYEKFMNPEGLPEKVIYRAFNSKECTKETFLVEQNAEYKKDKLLVFIRQNIDSNGDSADEEKCSLFYNSSGQIIRIERKNMDTGLTTTLNYFYNDKGFVDHYSVDYLADLIEYGSKNQPQEIYFKYDRKGNWIKRYWKSDKESRLEAKRKISYW